jgi:hypothetical protein
MNERTRYVLERQNGSSGPPSAPTVPGAAGAPALAYVIGL